MKLFFLGILVLNYILTITEALNDSPNDYFSTSRVPVSNNLVANRTSRETQIEAIKKRLAKNISKLRLLLKKKGDTKLAAEIEAFLALSPERRKLRHAMALSLTKSKQGKVNSYDRFRFIAFKKKSAPKKIPVKPPVKKDTLEKLAPVPIRRVIEPKLNEEPDFVQQHIEEDTVSNDSFQVECLKEHNAVRRSHGLPLLSLDRNLIASAQNSANHIASRPQYPLVHNTPELRSLGYGENLARGYESCQAAIDAWAEEVNIYNHYQRPTVDFNRPDFLEWGHYTQLVWESTTKVGCAAQNSSSGTVVVCRYFPAGNTEGQTPF